MHANSKALDTTGVQPLISDHNDVHTSHPKGVVQHGTARVRHPRSYADLSFQTDGLVLTREAMLLLELALVVVALAVVAWLSRDATKQRHK